AGGQHLIGLDFGPFSQCFSVFAGVRGFWSNLVQLLASCSQEPIQFTTLWGALSGFIRAAPHCPDLHMLPDWLITDIRRRQSRGTKREEGVPVGLVLVCTGAPN
ncbi:hypothetical protein M5D96_011670, partial [Drosophila gunungcola]